MSPINFTPQNPVLFDKGNKNDEGNDFKDNAWEKKKKKERSSAVKTVGVQFMVCILLFDVVKVDRVYRPRVSRSKQQNSLRSHFSG